MRLPFKHQDKVTIPFLSGSNEDDARTPALTQEQSPSSVVLGLTEIYSPAPDVTTGTRGSVRDVADMLLDMEKLTQSQYNQLRDYQARHPGQESMEWLLRERLVAQDDVQAARARLHGLEFQPIQPSEVEQQAFDMLDVEFIRNSHIMPVRMEGDVLVVATSDPDNFFALDDVKRRTGKDVRVLVCLESDIDDTCETFKEEVDDYSLDEIISDMTEVEVIQDEEQDAEDIERMAGQSPVIKFVNYLISNAIREGASDIHIEPKEKITRIRYRIDGVLFDAKQAPIKMHPAMVSRIKIMSNLDISERRLPQDGKVSVVVGGRVVDLRISTLPTSHGEKAVVRVLDSRSILLDLDQLGMDEHVRKIFLEQMGLPHGIFLVTGPTGSGKSTTLYSALRQMDGDRMNISTVEDPVEYELDFCNQVQTNEKIGLTFASALRSLLRQDPDIMMIGEIRDHITAQIAVQAALTGHLVLSTLHTNDAASSVTRLVNIGIDPYLIAASLNAILAQRLVRRICTKCKEPYKVPENMLRTLERAGIDKNELFHGRGCQYCRDSGFSGRVGIYEMLVIDDAFRNMINQDASTANMRRAFTDSGAKPMFSDGIQKVKQGLTTMEEVLRVTEIFDPSGSTPIPLSAEPTAKGEST